ncbi:hypothetical protein ACFXKS_00320 [Streptomyces scopuliridis]|uniref:hypothetical protein n=1 Tax=Streptomyces scopuliridis TaxID=452529 RepID=UPI00369AE625
MANATRTRRADGHAGAHTERTSEIRSGGGLRMHALHADLPIPYLTAGDVTANARAAGSKLAPPMPPPKRLAFYGGLGALAVLGAIDWPVALAIGAATMVARGGRREEGDADGGHAGNGARGARGARKTTSAASAAKRRSARGAKAGARGGTKKATAKT